MCRVFGGQWRRVVQDWAASLASIASSPCDAHQSPCPTGTCLPPSSPLYQIWSRLDRINGPHRPRPRPWMNRPKQREKQRGQPLLMLSCAVGGSRFSPFSASSHVGRQCQSPIGPPLASASSSRLAASAHLARPDLATALCRGGTLEAATDSYMSRAIFETQPLSLLPQVQSPLVIAPEAQGIPSYA